MLSIMLASWTGLCIYVYMRSVCVSDNDSAIVEPTQPTELKCEHLQCHVRLEGHSSSGCSTPARYSEMHCSVCELFEQCMSKYQAGIFSVLFWKN